MTDISPIRLTPSPTPGPAPAPNRSGASVDARLASTTPDLPRKAPLLPIAGTLGWAAGIGLGAGALLLRSTGAGWGAAALASGAWKGGALGAGLGASLLVADHLSGGAVKRQLDLIALDRKAQLWFVVSHPTKPWLASLGLGVADAARSSQERLYGPREPLDGPQDAFRHTFAAALFSLRAMREHGTAPTEAHELAIAAGEAHERDGQDNNDSFSRAMDTANNHLGTELVGDGRARPGEDADAAGFVTEHALRERVLAAIAGGQVQLVDRSAATPTVRSSTVADLPPVQR
ncbi:MAG: hypothetical protein JWM86_778 [Thermoleophilia bacterium]|nr:hypothetical protein [Thermoleophilia bacterium]